ncbi:MAG: hypothetical protein WDN49_00220 [Acetobacteraceae bacterium]
MDDASLRTTIETLWTEREALSAAPPARRGTRWRRRSKRSTPDACGSLRPARRAGWCMSG